MTFSTELIILAVSVRLIQNTDLIIIINDHYHTMIKYVKGQLEIFAVQTNLAMIIQCFFHLQLTDRRTDGHTLTEPRR